MWGSYPRIGWTTLGLVILEWIVFFICFPLGKQNASPTYSVWNCVVSLQPFFDKTARLWVPWVPCRPLRHTTVSQYPYGAHSASRTGIWGWLPQIILVLLRCWWKKAIQILSIGGVTGHGKLGKDTHHPTSGRGCRPPKPNIRSNRIYSGKKGSRVWYYVLHINLSMRRIQHQANTPEIPTTSKRDCKEQIEPTSPLRWGPSNFGSVSNRKYSSQSLVSSMIWLDLVLSFNFRAP